MMRLSRLGMLLTAGLLLGSGDAVAQARATTAAERTTVLEARPGLLRPGDAIRILIPQDEPLNGEFMVNERGIVVLPMLGPRAVAGQEDSAVRERIAAEYARVLPETIVAIEVTVLRRVLVRGEVRQPGSYLLATYEATVGDALSAAQGLTPDGRTDRLLLVRGDGAETIRLDRSSRLAALPLESGDEVVVPARSWILRNPAIVPALVSGAVSVVVTLLIVGMQ
jgi:protein involved in polysaccharide export with SLBB domain